MVTLLIFLKSTVVRRLPSFFHNNRNGEQKLDSLGTIFPDVSILSSISLKSFLNCHGISLIFCRMGTVFGKMVMTCCTNGLVVSSFKLLTAIVCNSLVMAAANSVRLSVGLINAKTGITLTLAMLWQWCMTWSL